MRLVFMHVQHRCRCKQPPEPGRARAAPFPEKRAFLVHDLLPVRPACLASGHPCRKTSAGRGSFRADLVCVLDSAASVYRAEPFHTPPDSGHSGAGAAAAALSSPQPCVPVPAPFVLRALLPHGVQLKPQ